MPDGEYKKDGENRRIIYGTVENNIKNRDKLKVNGNQKSNTR